MEKITLKPIAKELLFRVDDENSHFDVFSYGGTTTQERQLGTLYLVGHAKFDGEDLGYVLGLIGSLARREFYSQDAQKQKDSRVAFESALNKLNEVLDDFFTNKKLDLNIGVMSLSGDTVYISKLGKFKVGLARSGEYIDVLNNLALFQKSPESERKFSNVISGTVQPDDKIFAYIPSRPITSRERSLHSILVKEDQSSFTEHLARLASTTDSFACCGVHLYVEQVKEIPIEVPSVIQAQQPAKIMAAELSVGKKYSQLSSFRLAVMRSRPRMFLVAAAIIAIPFAGVFIARAFGENSATKKVAETALQNITEAENRFSNSDAKGARILLWDTLALLGTVEGSTAENAKEKVEESLDKIDNLSPILPTKTDKAWDGDTVTDGIYSQYDGNEYILDGNKITKNGKIWTESAPQDGVSMAIDGNIYVLTRGGTLHTFFLGKQIGEVETETVISDAKLAVFDDREAKNVYVADSVHKRIHAVEKASGKVTTTYNAEILPQIKEITVDENGDLLIYDGKDVWSIAIQQ